MSQFFTYYQLTEGEAAWKLGLADSKPQILRDHQPPLMTILDLDTAVEDGMTGEQLAAIKYRGPAYFDFDSTSIEEVIPKFHSFLDKLVDVGVDLNEVQLFASGGKGFHVIVPMEMFVQKPAPGGYAHLPHVFREMALKLFVDTLDLRVYTARRGRMFRVANVKRKNGRYKVPLTLKEARAMTPALYEELTSEPRPNFGEPPKPTFTPDLAVLFATGKQTVDAAMSRRKKNKGDEKLIAKFKGQWPDSLASVLTGEAVNGAVGFHKIAMQICIIAHKLGKTEDEVVASAGGLIETHASDGNRYNTPNKRRAELRRLYQYLHENVCYEFTVGGLKSVLPPGTSTPDLDDGLETPTTIDDDGNVVEEEYDFGTTLGVRVSRLGIFRKADGGESTIKICAVGFENPRELVNLSASERQVIGYQVDAFRDGKPLGPRNIEIQHFASRASFLKFTGPEGCTIQANDAQIGGILEVTRTMARRGNGTTYTVRREGLDLIPLPEAKDRSECVFMYVSRDGILTAPNEMRIEGMNFCLHGVTDPKGDYKSDLHFADPLSGTPAEADYLHRLFALAKPDTMARILGFMLAAYLSQPIRRATDNFPNLQVYGTAGSGKSSLVELLIRMHYNLATPRRVNCTSVTKYFAERSVAASASIPCIFDEFKPREMKPDQRDMITALIRANWDNAQTGKGIVRRETGGTLGTEMLANEAPVIFLAETYISQTAVVDRAILVPMAPQDRDDISDNDFMRCKAEKSILSRFGRSCVNAALSLRQDDLIEMLAKYKEDVTDALRPAMEAVNTRSVPNRPVHSNACILTGLEFGRQVLASKFGDQFDNTFRGFRDAILRGAPNLVQSNRSEPSKVLDTLAYLSRVAAEVPYVMRLGIDYIDAQDRTGLPRVDVRLKHAYDRYTLYCKHLGHERFFTDYDSFRHAMFKHAACVTNRPKSKLREAPSEDIARFDLTMLYNEGLTQFSSLEATESSAKSS